MDRVGWGGVEWIGGMGWGGVVGWDGVEWVGWGEVSG